MILLMVVTEPAIGHILFKTHKKMFKSIRLNSKKGFTLIELIVVITIIAILSSIGVASFVESSQNASMQTIQDRVITMLGVAKSRSLSQTAPPDNTKCIGSLKGYEVLLQSKQEICLTAICSVSPTTADCQAETVIESYTLPNDISFEDAPLPGPFRFPVLSNSIEGLNEPVQIIISGYGKEKSITVSPSGVVTTGATPTPSQ